MDVRAPWKARTAVQSVRIIQNYWHHQFSFSFLDCVFLHCRERAVGGASIVKRPAPVLTSKMARNHTICLGSEWPPPKKKPHFNLNPVCYIVFMSPGLDGFLPVCWKKWCDEHLNKGFCIQYFSFSAHNFGSFRSDSVLKWSPWTDHLSRPRRLKPKLEIWLQRPTYFAAAIARGWGWRFPWGVALSMGEGVALWSLLGWWLAGGWHP